MPAHVRRQCAIENNLPSQMLALEPRYLFDAAAVTTVADVTSEPTVDTSAASASTPDPDLQATLAADPEPASVSDEGFIYSENHANGDVVGFITTSADVDTFTITPATDTGTFTLVQSDSTHLRIDVLDNSLLDYEDGPILSGLTGAFSAFNGEPGLAFDVTVTEADTETEATATILVLFRDVNDAPEATTPDDSLIGLGETATVQVFATDQDVDGDSTNDQPSWSVITYDLESPPAGASIDANGLFSWTPTEAGTTTITVNVSNSGDFEQTVQFDVTVLPVVNIEGTGENGNTVEEGDALKYTVSLTTTTTDPIVTTTDVAPDALYGVSLNGFNSGTPGPSDLYLIDETTGAGTLIGNIGYAVNSIAFDPTTGLLYGSTTSWSGLFNGLLLIDPATGAATEIGAFGSGFTSILGLSFNSSGELFGWHDPGADDPVTIDKATGAATTLGPGTGTAGQVLAFDNSNKLILVTSSSQYDIDVDPTSITPGTASFTQSLGFDPGAGGADIHNTTGDLWASAFNGRTEDSFIRVTNLATDTFTDIDTDVKYLNALAFGSTAEPTFPTVTVDLTMVTFSGTATAGPDTDPDSDYEQVFYSDAALTNPITSVTLGGVHPDPVAVYVGTFDNDPPFNEADETVIITLPAAAITNAIPGVPSGAGTAAISGVTPGASTSAIPDDISAEGIITDTNNEAVIGGDDTGAVTEDDSAPNLTDSGTLTITDADNPPSEESFNTTVTPVGSPLGNVTIDAAGNWSYSIANAAVQYLANLETKVEEFTVTSVDGTAHTIEVTITGANDGANITGGISGVTEDNSDPTLSTGGTLGITDTDAGEELFNTTVTPVGTPLGNVTIDAAGNWTYTVANADVQYLADLETKVEEFTVTSVDGTPHTIEVTITGNNDGASITGGTGAVTEDDSAPNLTDSGTLTITDADNPPSEESFNTTVTPVGSPLGNVTIDAAGNWSYSVANADVQYLANLETKVEEFTVTSVDGTPHTIEVTITGTPEPVSTINDATNFGIDPAADSGDPPAEEGGEEEGGEEGGEGGGPDTPGDTSPAEQGDEITPEEAAEIEAEVEALVTEGDFSETTEGPAAGKPDSQQPQTRAEEVAEIISIMDKAIALAGCRELPHGPSL